MIDKLFSIRQANLGDAEQVVHLVQELAEYDGDTSPITPEFVLQYLAGVERQILLADLHGQILGMLSYSVQPDLYHAGPVGTIELLVVRQTERGQGVGSALVWEVIRRARAQRWVEVSVSTMPENQPAIEFYKKHGFTDLAVLLEQHLN
jgi:ribosomal protein S18 acetylase RimI-like enzyme